MANGRNPKKRGHDSSRDAGGFVALPWSVLDSAAYQGLSHPARSLLLEMARQYVRDNNGRLLCSRAYMSGRGWKSHDVLQRAKGELIAAGFLYETVMGQRPNKASWYAVTWYALDWHADFDAGAVTAFKRGAYRCNAMSEDLRADQRENAGLSPSGGTVVNLIGPRDGTARTPPVPRAGPMTAGFN